MRPIRIQGKRSFQLTIQIPPPTLRDPPSPLILILLQNANLLQTLHHLAIDASTGINMMARSRAAVLGAAVDLAQAADADRLAEVDVSSDGSGTRVKPVERRRYHQNFAYGFLGAKVWEIRQRCGWRAAADQSID